MSGFGLNPTHNNPVFFPLSDPIQHVFQSIEEAPPLQEFSGLCMLKRPGSCDKGFLSFRSHIPEKRTENSRVAIR